MIESITNAGLRTFTSLLTRSKQHARLSILIFHRVLPFPDPIFPGEIHAERFNSLMEALVKTFNILPLSEATARLKSGSLPTRSLCITFDDGYRDNAEVALPILNRLNIPATFFVSTSFLDGGCMWNDVVIEAIRNTKKEELDLTTIGLDHIPVTNLEQRQFAIGRVLSELKYQPQNTRDENTAIIVEQSATHTPTDLMMRPEQVQLLAKSGMEIGGHTVTHPILTTLDSGTARSEIADGKQYLEDLTGEKIMSFAYPNGKPGQDYSSEHVEIVKKLGFSTAVSTSWGTSTSRSNPFQLPRFTPWDENTTRFRLRLLQNILVNKAVTI